MPTVPWMLGSKITSARIEVQGTTVRAMRPPPYSLVPVRLKRTPSASTRSRSEADQAFHRIKRADWRDEPGRDGQLREGPKGHEYRQAEERNQRDRVQAAHHVRALSGA